ncbi:hypothetical protein AT6N2_C1924 [Agrobacterium tumefaciens]|nr:hypothetical protein AT6N2_C1924 [Agrobacterium tumefaciens]
MLFQAVPGLLDIGRDLIGGFAADEIDHAGPECTGADLARHQVGPVKTEGRRRGQDFTLALHLLIGIGFDIHALVRGEKAGLCHPDLMGDRCLQEVDERLCGGRFLGDGDKRARAQNRLAELRLGGVGRHVEEINVRPHLGTRREEGGNEGRLMVQIALRRNVEEALGAVTEIRGGNGCNATAHIFLVLGNLAEFIDRRHNRRIGELHLIRRPFLVDVEWLRAQHQVFHPVGGRPAGRAAGTEANAPGRAAIGDDLVGQLKQVFHAFGHFIARFFEILRHVPDERLHICLEGESEIGLVAVPALVAAEIDPGFARAIILLDPFGRLVAERHEEAFGSQIGQQTRLRENGDIGWRTSLRIDDDLLLVVFRRGVSNVNARRIGEIGKYGLEKGLVLTAPGSENRQCLTLQVGMGRLEVLIAFPVEFGVLARREFQIGSKGRTRQQHDRSSRRQ